MKRLVALAGLCAVLTGCRHRQTAVYLPAPLPTAVPLAPAPEPPLVAQVPVDPGPPLPAKDAPKKVRKPKKKVVVPAVAAAPVAAPVQVASSGLPPAEAIGALSGGDASPAKLQEASSMLAGLEKKIAGLPAEWKTQQKDGLVRVRYFESQAQVAIRGGDGEGAVTLATKARLLLEDLVK